MKILGIETSCDETAVCVVEAEGGIEAPRFRVLGDALYSQAKTHAEYGGVFPALAKREHAKNLGPLLVKALKDAGLYIARTQTPHVFPRKDLRASQPEGAGTDFPAGTHVESSIKKILEREIGLFEITKEIIESIEKPDINYIAVTAGPGLEPALWVGISFARALGEAWNIPVIPTNHMEGHVLSPLLKNSEHINFPALALLISGGHTELVLMKDWMKYEVIGQTRDDAVGEAFDKVARLLNLPYPGGPHISKLAAEARIAHSTPAFSKEGVGGGVKLPRPMLKTKDFDFSFSGIKTAVLYSLRKSTPSIPLLNQEGETRVLEGGDVLSEETKREYALEFENAVTEVLVEKTRKAIEHFNIKTLILGGGVVANTYIRSEFEKLVSTYPEVKLLLPEIKDSTDNALMIAAAGYLNILSGAEQPELIKAQGNLSISK
jgi:N6-L-threonylcarbamoyladenine synthase